MIVNAWRDFAKQVLQRFAVFHRFVARRKLLISVTVFFDSKSESFMFPLFASSVFFADSTEHEIELVARASVSSADLDFFMLSLIIWLIIWYINSY